MSIPDDVIGHTTAGSANPGEPRWRQQWRLWIARSVRLMTRLRRLQPRLGRLHARLLRLSGGRIRRSRVLAGGQPVLALTTIGRRSGKLRSTTVAYLREGEGYAVGALNLGSDWQPAWYLNLRADPRAWVEVDGRRLEVRAREAHDEEAEALWERFYSQLSLIRSTRRVARRHVPVVVLERNPEAAAHPDRAGPASSTD